MNKKRNNGQRVKLTSSQEVQCLQHLSQATAAWAMGTTPRELRDHPEIPRDESGKYDWRDLRRFLGYGIRRPELSEQDQEMILKATYRLFTCSVDSADFLKAFFDLISRLQNRHGDSVLLSIFDAITDQLRAAQEYSLEPSCITESEIEAKEAESVRSIVQMKVNQLKLNQLRFVEVCEICHRVRSGKRWLKREPPSDYAIQNNWCPDCIADE